MSDWEVVSSPQSDWEAAGSKQPSHAGNPVLDALGGLTHTLVPAMSALPGKAMSVAKKQEAKRAARSAPKNVGDVIKNAFDDTVGIAPDVLSTAIKPAMEAASWAVPATKIFKGAGILPKSLNLALQGAGQGGLATAAQDEATPESILKGMGFGAVVNPAMAGAGNVITDKIPKYLGFRAYGPAGLKLPDVLNAQHEYGTEDLKGVRDYILESSKRTTTKPNLFKAVTDLADQPEWVGTPGLSEKQMVRGGAAGNKVIESGELKTIEKQLEQSTDAFDFYSRLKNMAYPKGDSPAANRLGNFMRAAAHSVREQIINTTDNPEVTRKAMDTYAAQMAIKAAKNGKNVSSVVGKMRQYIPEGEGALSVIGMIAAVPGLSQVAPYLLVDALISNKVVAPKIASGLTHAGQVAGDTGIGSILRRLGVQAGVSGGNPTESQELP